MKSLTLMIVSSMFVLSSNYVNAAHIVIDESTISGGDFANTFADATILSVEADGVTGIFGGVDKGDAFVFSGLATGVQTFEYSITTASEEAFTLDVAEGGLLPLNNVFELFSDGSTINGTFATSAGFNGILTGIFSTAGNIDVSYTLGLKVSPVPVPAAVWLFASGFGLLGAIGARRKR